MLLLALVPLYLGIRALDGGMDSLRYAFSDVPLRALWNSLLLAVTVTLLTTLLALPAAWLTTCADLPGRRFFAVALFLPLAIPSYVGALALVAALGPGGLIAGSLRDLGLPVPNVYGFWGAAVALALFSYPYLLLPFRSALLRMDHSYEEVARSLGRSPFHFFFHIQLPLLKPAWVAGGLLVMLYVLSDFGAVALLRYDSFTRVIYLQYQFSFDRSTAAVLGLMLVLLTTVILAMELKTRGSGRYSGRRVATAQGRKVRHLGLWKGPALCFCLGLLAVALVMPFAVLLSWVLKARPWHHLDASWLSASLNSVGLSAGAATLAILSGLPIAWLAVRHTGRRTLIMERLAYSGFALPGLVIGLSLVYFSVRMMPFLYQTIWLVLMAYVIRFLPQASGNLTAALQQIPRQLEESSRSLGKSPFRTFRKITTPLLLPGLLSGWGLVFLTCMKELPATLILSPAGFNTLATEIWTHANEALLGPAALYSLTLLVVAALPMMWLISRES